MRKFRKKPVVIEAEQFHEPTLIRWDSPDKTVVGNLDPPLPDSVEYEVEAQGKICYFIYTLEGRLTVSDGDWIITGIKGEKYPCKPDIFEATYEGVTE